MGEKNSPDRTRVYKIYGGATKTSLRYTRFPLVLFHFISFVGELWTSLHCYHKNDVTRDSADGKTRDKSVFIIGEGSIIQYSFFNLQFGRNVMDGKGGGVYYSILILKCTMW